MTRSPGSPYIPSVVSVLHSLNRREIELWVEDGNLRYRAPTGRMDEETQALLRTIAQDERSTLEFLAEACQQLNG